MWQANAPRGTISFPLAFEGPPGFVHGGFLAVFFDCAMQHHNCEVGVAGKTTSLDMEYRRPTPLLTPLNFAIERSSDARRITSTGQIEHDGTVLCRAPHGGGGRRSRPAARRVAPPDPSVTRSAPPPLTLGDLLEARG